MERYDPQSIEAKWQKVWADEKSFHVPNPDRPRWPAATQQVLRGRDAAVPVRRSPHGAHVELHDRRRDHAHRAAARACRCCGRWATTPSAFPPRTRRSRKAGIRAPSPSATSSRSASRCTGWAGRSTGAARSRPPTRPTTGGRSGCSCGSTSGPRLSQGGARQVVPERPDRARERAGRRRPLRALRRRGRGEEPDAVVLPDHGLRGRAARRDGPAGGLAGACADDAAQLDRALPGRARRLQRRGERGGASRLHDAARHVVRGDVLRPGAREPAGPAARRRLGARGTRCSTTSAGLPRAPRSSERRRRRTASSPGGTPSTPSTASRSRSGSPTTS